MASSSFYLLFLTLSWSFFLTKAIQPSQKQVLLQLRKQLEYPKQLDFWANTSDDLCYLSSPQVNITCENNYVTELKILGLSPDQQLKKVSQLPDLPNLPNSLTFLYLSKNSFSGQIPVKYGQLPNRLQCGNKLAVVDISLNRFTGGLPSCLSNELNNRNVKFDGNCLMVDVEHQKPSSYCVEEARGVEVDPKTIKDSGKGMSPVMLVGVILGSILVLVLLVFGSVVICRRISVRGLSEPKLLPKQVQDYSVTGYPSELLTSARFVSEAAKLGTGGMPVHRLFSFDELKEATRDFHRSTLIGEGSTGKIYKGKLENGTDIAIRHLTVSKKYTIRNLKLRLDLLARLRHPHLVCLLGHCISNESDSNKVYLVYEYVDNGNYRSFLAGNDPEKVLKWEDRLRVLSGVAKAVHFLHTGLIPGFFNNRLKANNILLNENGMAKLSDYGLSIIAEDIKQEDANGEGVESWQMKNLEDDVYNFGFILLESLVGPSAASRKDEFLMNEMASFETEGERKKVVDPIVLASSSPESLSVIISITKKCFVSDSWARPSFEDVLWHLQYAAQVQANAKRPAEAVLLMKC
ncbi:putative protein kinase RLK-Pelle-LRR-VI-1 family [Helianthus annuus]|nr:putative protein kinase RLK-Pelle-LRR-VI-1 family [Helianthus annuus]